MKKLTVCLILLTVLMLTFVPSCQKSTPAPEAAAPETSPPAAETIEIKFATSESENHFRTPIMKWFAEELDKRTDGRTETTVYAGGTLGGSTELPDNILNGICDMGYILPSFLPGLIPISDFLNTPMLVNDAEAQRYVASDLIDKGYIKLDGAKILQVHGDEGAYLFMKGKKVATVEEFKGTVLFSSPSFAPLAAGLGASLSATPPPEIYSSLDRGVVDGGICGPSLAMSLKLDDLINYICWTPLANDHQLAIINEAKWNSLPADIQPIVQELSAEMEEKISSALPEENQKAYDYFSSAGAEIYTLSSEELQKIEDIAAPIIAGVVADMDAKQLPGTTVYDIIVQDLKDFEAANK